MSAEAEEPMLTQADWDAADLAIGQLPETTIVPPSERVRLAKIHSAIGSDLFQLFFFLREPKDKYEEWARMFFHDMLTPEQYYSYVLNMSKRPVDQEMIEGIYSQLQNRLWLYSQGLDATHRASRTSDLQKRKRLERTATRSFASAAEKLKAYRQEFVSVMIFAEELRIESNLGLAAVSEYSETNAAYLACKIFLGIRDRWKLAIRISREQRRNPNLNTYKSASQLFWENYQAPNAQTIETMLKQELVAARLSFRKASMPTADVEVRATKATIQVETAFVQASHIELSRNQAPAERVESLLAVQSWSQLSVGITHDRKVYAVIAELMPGSPFPKGHATKLPVVDGQLLKLLHAFAHSTTLRSVPISEVLKILEMLPPSATVQRDSRTRAGEITLEMRSTELLQEVALARSNLQNVLKECGRQFREFVDGPKGKSDPCFCIRDQDVKTGIAIRFLVQNEHRTSFFGVADGG